jgi:superfamily II DNA or RNA helicase
MIFKLNDNSTKIILKNSTKEEYNQLKLYLSRYVKNFRFMPRYKLGVWDGKVDFFNNGIIEYGLWYEVYKCCKEYGYKIKFENKENIIKDTSITKKSIIEFCEDFYKDHKLKNSDNPFFPYEHQIDAIHKILVWKFGIIEVATAGGKSLIFGTLLFYYLKEINKNAKALLIVPTINLVTQFYNDIMEYNLGFNQENKNPLNIRIDEIMSQQPRKYFGEEEPNVYIGTYQSLEKRDKEWFQQFDIVCTDESHTAKSKTIKSILTKTIGYAKIRFGMSGTYPPDGSSELFTIESLMGPKLLLISAKTLMDKGLISNVKIKSIIINHNDRNFAEKVYLIKRNGGGNKAWLLEKEYVHNSQRRREFLRKLITKFKKNSLILFINIDFGKSMYDYFRDNIPGIDFYYIDGGTKAKKRDYIKQQMENTEGNVKVLVASYGTLSTGVNIKSITNVVFTDSYKSDQKVRQSIGRALRLHKEKEKAIIFDIVDRFHPSYKNILYTHYLHRKKEIYNKQQYPFDEIRVSLG